MKTASYYYMLNRILFEGYFSTGATEFKFIRDLWSIRFVDREKSELAEIAKVFVGALQESKSVQFE